MHKSRAIFLLLINFYSKVKLMIPVLLIIINLRLTPAFCVAVAGTHFTHFMTDTLLWHRAAVEFV